MGNPGLLEIGLDIYEGCGMTDQIIVSLKKWPGGKPGFLGGNQEISKPIRHRTMMFMNPAG